MQEAACSSPEDLEPQQTPPPSLAGLPVPMASLPATCNQPYGPAPAEPAYPNTATSPAKGEWTPVQHGFDENGIKAVTFAVKVLLR